MLRVTFHSLLAHKLRLVLTGLAIVLGVGFVAGTLILSDTLNSTFNNLFATAYSGTDVGVAASRVRHQGGRRRRPGEEPPAGAGGRSSRRCAASRVREAEGDLVGFAEIVTSTARSSRPLARPRSAAPGWATAR